MKKITTIALTLTDHWVVLSFHLRVVAYNCINKNIICMVWTKISFTTRSFMQQEYKRKRLTFPRLQVFFFSVPVLFLSHFGFHDFLKYSVANQGQWIIYIVTIFPYVLVIALRTNYAVDCLKMFKIWTVGSDNTLGKIF